VSRQGDWVDGVILWPNEENDTFLTFLDLPIGLNDTDGLRITNTNRTRLKNVMAGGEMIQGENIDFELNFRARFLLASQR
jgi:hypothetical protein